MKIKYIWKGLDMSSKKKPSMTTHVFCNITPEVVQNSFYSKHRKSEKVHYSEMWFDIFLETSFEISIPNATNVHGKKTYITILFIRVTLIYCTLIQ